ncbi:MAG: M48 family metallopeptidase [Xanthomonadales bacterium]|jgi:Zn-dependent protease with chaperone function|nr:M48 family metallopeptidase [Xanthomonadales bacterium]
MNFFEEQARARGQSKGLVVMVILATVVIALLVGGLLSVVGWQEGDPEAALGLMLLGAGTTVVVIALGSLWKSFALRAGGGKVARELGGLRVTADSRDFHLRRYYNVVEEMAIASGVPMPELYVLEHELAINAFAAGWSPADAAVCVTRGALERLSRDELQGVIGHEFSHILNGDMRLNIRLMGLVFGILLIGLAGEKLMRARSSNSRDAAGIVALGFGLFVIGYVGVFVARLLKASISRQREYLADASAVQFTRQTAGIAGALKKAAGYGEGTRVTDSDCEEIAHMMFGDALGLSGWYATHPPLEDRIRKLDPSFRPEQLKKLADAHARHGDRLNEEPLSALSMLHAGASPSPPRSVDAPAHAPRGATEPPVLPEIGPAPIAGLSASIAHPADAHVALATRLRDALPEPLMQAARTSELAPALVLGLLVVLGREGRAAELGVVEQHWGSALSAWVRPLLAELESLHPLQRLPLLQLALPQLKRRPIPEQDKLVATLDALVALDRRLDVYEYCLLRLLKQALAEARQPERVRIAGRLKLAACMDASAIVLSVLAAAGHEDREQARQAFLSAWTRLHAGAARAYAPPADWPSALDNALAQLDQLQLAGKEILLETLAELLAYDGRIAVNEAELLRVVAAALHCPMPPLLPQA